MSRAPSARLTLVDVWCRHRSKPRHHLRSLRVWLRDRRRDRLARETEWRPAYGVLKVALELTLPFVDVASRGEVIGVGVEHAGANRNHRSRC
ncbi:MAG: hypothetical protein HYU51_18060 [Candidatus Rokubacteria bacterium]|nr:hypothetical protein [Candidatus Rokubacteria bacterium]